MSDMLQTFVKKEMERRIKEQYPHMQHPAGMYASVVQVKECQGSYVCTLRLLDQSMNIDHDFPEIPNVKTKVELRRGDIAVILLLYGENTVFILGRYEP